MKSINKFGFAFQRLISLCIVCLQGNFPGKLEIWKPADLSIAMATVRKVWKVSRAVLRGWRKRGKRRAYSSLCSDTGHWKTAGGEYFLFFFY